MYTLCPIILAGGSGTRLWPLSREDSPKHLLSLEDPLTLLQKTLQRVLRIPNVTKLFVVTHETQRYEVDRQILTLNARIKITVLAEPESKNTLPAIAWATEEIMRLNSETLVAVFPSDHHILQEESFQLDLQKALQIAAQGHLVTFGVQADGPRTGYGYIEALDKNLSGGAFINCRFIEKPDHQKATSYVQQGNYYWNTGIVVFQPSLFQEELLKQEPEISHSIKMIADAGDNRKVIEHEYHKMKKTSIDYGLMEKAPKIAMIPARFQWNDLGSWETVYQQKEKDMEGNGLEGNVIALDTEDSLLISKHGLLATLGLKNTIVVQTNDAVLVASRDKSQDIKKIVKHLKSQGSNLVENHTTVNRPWGTFSVLEEGCQYKIKKISVNPGQSLSLQSHQHRAEHWFVVEGTARIDNGINETILKKNESTIIPKGEKHRLSNPGTVPLIIIEIQTGDYLGEDDIQRFEDLYGRI